MESKIFTEAELKEIELREKGDKSDKTGIFSSRIKPKIKEILDVWIPKKKELENMVKVKNGKK